MPTAVATLSGMPCSFEQGVTVRFTDSDSRYPATLWTAKLVLNNGVDAPVEIAGTTYNTTGFQFEIPASQTFTPGTYQWAQYFTAISPTTEKARGKTGAVDVLPNLSLSITPSFAQQMVMLLEAANKDGAGSRRSSVSFNGQSVSWNSPTEFQDQWTFWKSRVIAEQRKAASARGEDVSGRVGLSFAGASCYPFCR